MKTKTNLFMKRVIPLAMALLFVLSTVLVPVKAQAAEKPKALASYIMKKGEKWTLNVYDVADNAKFTYKTSKKSVATVSTKGVVKAVKTGKATITTTVKQGSKKYTLKTKITVKSKLTTHDKVFREHGEFGLTYKYCFDLADANGWLDNEAATTWLYSFYQMVEFANDMAANPNKYTEEEMKEILGAIDKIYEQVPDMVSAFVEPYEG